MLSQTIDAVRDAGKLMLSFDHPDVYTKEGHANFVTQGDLAVQQYLLPRLAGICPDSVFLAEEKQNEPLTDRPTWVIDPIDGTFNYMRGRNCSSISVALLINHIPVLGVVLNPYADELFSAESGKGAFLNGKQIHVSSTPFEQAVVSFGTSPYNPGLARRSMAVGLRFLLEAGDLRRTGSAAIDLCDVACGRSDVFFELTLNPWDVAAGALIIEEAGGVFAMPERDGVSFAASACILAASPVCFERAKASLNETEEGEGWPSR